MPPSLRPRVDLAWRGTVDDAHRNIDLRRYHKEALQYGIGSRGIVSCRGRAPNGVELGEEEVHAVLGGSAVVAALKRLPASDLKSKHASRHL
jgi:hypothetical protein